MCIFLWVLTIKLFSYIFPLSKAPNVPFVVEDKIHELLSVMKVHAVAYGHEPILGTQYLAQLYDWYLKPLVNVAAYYWHGKHAHSLSHGFLVLWCTALFENFYVKIEFDRSSTVTITSFPKGSGLEFFPLPQTKLLVDGLDRVDVKVYSLFSNNCKDFTSVLLHILFLPNDDYHAMTSSPVPPLLLAKVGETLSLQDVKNNINK